MGETWRKIDYERNEMSVFTSDNSILSLQSRQLVSLRIKYALVDPDTQAEIMSVEFTISINFETPELLVEEEELVKEEVEKDEEEEDDTSEDSSTDTTDDEDAGEDEFEAFAGIIVDEEKGEGFDYN